jgi:hypothetical protein
MEKEEICLGVNSETKLSFNVLKMLKSLNKKFTSSVTYHYGKMKYDDINKLLMDKEINELLNNDLLAIMIIYESMNYESIGDTSAFNIFPVLKINCGKEDEISEIHFNFDEECNHCNFYNCNECRDTSAFRKLINEISQQLETAEPSENIIKLISNFKKSNIMNIIVVEQDGEILVPNGEESDNSWSEEGLI